MKEQTGNNLALRKDGDGAFGGPLLLVDGDSLGTPTVTRQEVERVREVVDDGGVDQLATVVLVHEHHHNLDHHKTPNFTV